MRHIIILNAANQLKSRLAIAHVREKEERVRQGEKERKGERAQDIEREKREKRPGKI